MMTSLGELIKEYRNTHEDSLRTFASKCELSYTYVMQLERGISARAGNPVVPTIDTLQKIASAMGLTLHDLLTRTGYIPPIHVNEIYSDSKHPNSKQIVTNKKIPILGTIRAGIPIMASDNFGGELDLGSEYQADFALHVTGDSMSWAGIHANDIALLRHTTVAQHGDIVAAGMADGDWTATLKYYISNNGSPLLRAANPDYQDITLDDRYRIIGVVVHVIKDSPALGEYNALLAAKQLADSEWARVIEAATGKGITPTALSGFMEVMQMMVNYGKK